MAEITSREELKQYCLRRLGAPVIEVNCAEEQLEDRIDDAFQYYFQYHFDAVETMYWAHQLTQEDVDNRYLTVANNIIGITRIFPLSSTWTKNYMWDIRYQLRLHELWDFSTVTMTNYRLTMQHLRDLELLFNGEIPVRYQRHTNKLYLDMDWGSVSFPVGSTVVLEGYRMLEPSEYPKVYNDMWLKRYTTALFKRQFSENLKKFSGVALPGGITLNGDKLFQEAMSEIQQLEQEMQIQNEIPPAFYIG